MKNKKHRKNSVEPISEIEIEAESADVTADTEENSESEEAAEKEKNEREKQRRQIIDKNSKWYLIVTTILSALGLYFGFYLFPQMFFLIFSNDALQNSGTLKLLCSIMGFFVYFFYLLSHYLRKQKKNPNAESIPEILEFYPRSVQLKPALLCGVSGFCMNLSTSALLAILPIPESIIGKYSAGTESLLYTDNIGLSLIYIVLLAPLCEETMFRGFLLHTLQKAFPEKAAVIVVAIAFALPHIHPLWIIVALFSSYFFTLVRWRYKNLIYPLIMHIGFNLATVPMLLLMNTDVYTVLFDNIIAELIYLVFGGLTVFFCLKTVFDDIKEQIVNVDYKIR